MRRLYAFVPLLFAACSPAAPTPPPGPPRAAASASTTAAPANYPDAAGLGKLARELDASCQDTCCVPRRDLIGMFGPRPSPEDKSAARATLQTADDPRVRALAIRVITRAVEPSDQALLETVVDDERTSGKLPLEHLTQAMAQCYPVTWKPTTPSKEALLALSRLFGKQFATRTAYREWSSAHSDPEAAVETWVDRLAMQRPPPEDLVARLRAKDEMLFLRVMIFTCEGDGGCGVKDAELGALLKSKIDGKRALAWLDGSEKLPEWSGARGSGQMARSVLVNGESIFTAAHVPSLKKLFDGNAFGRTAPRAELAVLLSRLAPADAKTFWRTALAKGTATELEEHAAGIVLREAAKRDAVAMEKEIGAWFFAQEPKDAEGWTSEGVWLGLSEADPLQAAIAFGRLHHKRDFAVDNNRAATNLLKAATRAGCKDLPDERTLIAYGLKGQSADEWKVIEAKANTARVALVAKAKACAANLRAMKP